MFVSSTVELALTTDNTGMYTDVIFHVVTKQKAHVGDPATLVFFWERRGGGGGGGREQCISMLEW